MSSNILITGAGGYVWVSEQAEALSKLGISVLQLDLSDEDAVVKSVLQHDISIVIHTASAMDPSMALPLITALSKQKQVNGSEAIFIHTSGLGAFYDKTGWPAGLLRDTDAVFDTEKRLADSFPIRKTDVAVIEHAEKRGVTSFIVVPSTVYGQGSGEWNKLSIILPLYVRASLSAKAVYKFPDYSKVAGVHISDLTALYGLIVEQFLRGESIPSGREGYYFALAHDIFLGEVGDHLASELRDRGVTTNSEARTYSDEQAAATSLGVPVQFVQMLWDAGANIVAEIPRSIGWKPAWDKARFLQHIGDEVQAVVDLGKPKSSLVDSLLAATSG
ncbi:hypothetical protein BGW36DRAFT_305676 [Talaromyces proteolyticus]|uniref:NAD-dependent epimerase/dehydratase domain-containing protein n=1 Tax=Talaromyces proteolyticus TaxID=1131652 RepID=A0AAD4PVP2_9EURO|nr:uncharacterized protein BGW36DRAFT_305676 [Talaromyces proteolyticus]KAH8691553.1 hypothetical protein BGW36DRAFT_305676 [Talaromyces proteolyticus]